MDKEFILSLIWVAIWVIIFCIMEYYVITDDLFVGNYMCNGNATFGEFVWANVGVLFVSFILSTLSILILTGLIAMGITLFYILLVIGIVLMFKYILYYIYKKVNKK